MLTLTPEKALIFRITHIDNVPWILEHGLHCRTSDVRDPNFHEIGNPELISKRARRVVPIPPGGTLGDYVPFYFTPYTPMLLNIKTGYGGMKQIPMPEIAFLVSSVHRLAGVGVPFVLTDRHAYLEAAEFTNTPEGLQRVRWEILEARDFRKVDPDDLEKFERYQAEALPYKHLPLSALLGIACHVPMQKAKLDSELTRRGLSLKVVARPEWYF